MTESTHVFFNIHIHAGITHVKSAVAFGTGPPSTALCMFK